MAETTESERREAKFSLIKLLAATIALVVGVWVVNFVMDRLSQPPLVPSDVETAMDPSFLPANELERLVATYEQRTTEVSTPSDFLNLGQLYLEQARVSSDPARYLQAQAAFQIASDLSPDDPTPVVGLARTALALHDFTTAAEVAERVLVDIPSRLDALAVVADAKMAIGDVAAAHAAIDRLRGEAGEVPPVVVRQAQLAWLEGQLDESLELARAAVPAGETNPQRLAWYQAYASNSAFLFGEVEVAGELSMLALANDPQSIPALTVASRVAAAEGDIERSISLLEQATAAVPDPELNGELGDLYLMTGEEELAEEQFGLVEVIGTLAEAQDVFNRQVARFYADHDLQTERALALAAAELEIRQDPLGFDTYAWILYRAGRFDDALAAIDQAKAGGFQDAELFYHEGLIAIALGDGDRAVRSLEAALALNPHFDLLGAADATRLLAELR
ncbi:MAG: tetratricopeptide repeat protein [Acidimicrobiia bacterium]